MKTMISFQCETLEEAQAVLTACAAIGKEPHACSKQYVNSKELLNRTLEQVGVKPADPEEPTGCVYPPTPNVSPGEPSITKIGEKAKTYLLNELKAAPRTLGYADFYKYEEHLKLLWKRGEVKFNGDDFYV